MPWFWLGILLCLIGCECGGAELRVEGDHPYIRCMAMEIDEGESGVGTLDGRELVLRDVETVEFFSVRGASLDALGEGDGADLQVVLGGFARDEEHATELLAAIAARGPALLLPGGEDSNEVFDDALEEVSGLIDLRGVARVSFGDGPGLLVVPGAPGGRYGRGDDACGYAASDIEELNDVAQEGDRLLSWMAPRGEGGADVALLGAHVGDANLGDFRTHHQLGGGVYAFPREAAGFADEDASEYVVSALGALIVGADGGRRLGQALRIRISGTDWILEE